MCALIPCSLQLELLEKHIVDNILPVKGRLLAQMAATEVRAHCTVCCIIWMIIRNTGAACTCMLNCESLTRPEPLVQCHCGTYVRRNNSMRGDAALAAP